MNKTLKYAALVILVIAPLVYLFPKVALFYLCCGLYDVSRNKGLDSFVIRRYFAGNGLLTWLLSPLNILMDILALPYINKGVYKLEDLPGAYQEELKSLLASAEDEDLVSRLAEKTRGLPRAMIFFKWYGANAESFLELPVFQTKYRYIQTIGVSVFNKRESTSKHFGPLRATLRVLYNINAMEDRSAYIEVGRTKNYWKDEKLFIFDDTLMHQSFNESDQPRYCMFIDILRPSAVPAVFASIVRVLRVFLQSVNGVFYKNWTFLKG